MLTIYIYIFRIPYIFSRENCHLWWII